MSNFVSRAGLQVDSALAEFVDSEVLVPLGQDANAFWQGFAELLADFAPRNRALLKRRDNLQAQIDAWHREMRGQPHDPVAYARFLEEIGYLVPDPGEFTIGTENAGTIWNIVKTTPAGRARDGEPQGDRLTHARARIKPAVPARDA